MATPAQPPPTYAEFVAATSVSCGVLPYYVDSETNEHVFGVTVRTLEAKHTCLSLALGGRDLVFTSKDGRRWHFDLRSAHHIRAELMPFAKELGVPDAVFAPIVDDTIALTREQRRAAFYPMFIEALVAAGATDIRVEDTVSAALNECEEELGLDVFNQFVRATARRAVKVADCELASWRDGGMKRIRHILFAFEVGEKDAKAHALAGQDTREKGAYMTPAEMAQAVFETAEYFAAKTDADLFDMANAIAAVQKFMWIIDPVLWKLGPHHVVNLEATLKRLLAANAALEGVDKDKYAPVDMPDLIEHNDVLGIQEMSPYEVVSAGRAERRRVQVPL